MKKHFNKTGMTAFKHSERGLTLIEMMVVIVILGILVGLIGGRIIGREEDARLVRARVDIQTIETAIKLYKLDNGGYPTTDQGLQALVEAPQSGTTTKWREGGYLDKGRVPKDPWGGEYIYLSPGMNGDFDIISYGADGVPGGEGKNKDTNNWEIDE